MSTFAPFAPVPARIRTRVAGRKTCGATGTTHSADTYGFFSPLTHARPVFFRATGDLYPRPAFAPPVPFNLERNLPKTGGPAPKEEDERP
jgi:hypothetical protein